jgi:hypothetical protein
MKRLRPAWSPAQLQQLYRTPHDHTRWADHVERIEATIALARKLGPMRSGADLSCGSAAVLAAMDLQERHLGDLAPGYAYVGPIERTIVEIPDVDVFVNTETLEHVHDPPAVLAAVRAKAGHLVLSTPVDNWADRNLEHYWAWSATDVERMLATAGFEVIDAEVLDFRARGPEYYAFGMWTCR